MSKQTDITSFSQKAKQRASRGSGEKKRSTSSRNAPRSASSSSLANPVAPFEMTPTMTAGNKVTTATIVHHTWVLDACYDTEADADRIVSHTESLFRFTYRCDFPLMSPYPISSDSGWGCMLRAAQMLMGSLLSRLILGRGWRLPFPSDTNNARRINALKTSPEYRQLMRCFADRPGAPCLFSVHHLAAAGMRYDRLPGEWCGPAAACQVLRDLLLQTQQAQQAQLVPSIAVMVAANDVFYSLQAEQLCRDSRLDTCLLADDPLMMSGGEGDRKEGLAEHNLRHLSKRLTTTRPTPVVPALAPAPVTSSNYPLSSTDAKTEEVARFFDPLLRPPPSLALPWAKPLLLLVPLRLGVDTVDKGYRQELLWLLRQRECLGMLGGRPGHALFFAGQTLQADPANSKSYTAQQVESACLLGLDPHTTFTTMPLLSSTNDIDNDDGRVIENLVGQIHVKRMQKVSWPQLDPSLALAFLFEDRLSFEEFCRSLEDYDKSNEADGDGEVKGWKQRVLTVQRTLPPSYLNSDNNENKGDGHDVDEDGAGEAILMMMGEGGVGADGGGEDNDDEYVFL